LTTGYLGWDEFDLKDRSQRGFYGPFANRPDPESESAFKSPKFKLTRYRFIIEHSGYRWAIAFSLTAGLASYLALLPLDEKSQRITWQDAGKSLARTGASVYRIAE
jgi:hypothetical protein